MIDIQAGDVVVCVSDDWLYPWSFNPKCGDVLRVSGVRWVNFEDGTTGPSLRLLGKPQDRGWSAHRFQKIGKATDDFTTQIKAIRPIREDA